MSTRGTTAIPDEVVEGRPSGYTSMGDWVLLAPISDRAVRIYGLLRMHCGATGKAWPSQKTLAAMLRVKKVDPVQAAIRELVEIGAVDVEVVTTQAGRHNRYIVHLAPPPGYDQGPRDRTSYYAEREGVTPEFGVTRLGGHPENRGDGSPLSGGSKALQEEALQLKPSSPAAPSDALFAELDTPAKPATPAVVDALFEEFWKTYPRKTDKKKTREAWGRKVKANDGRELINAAARYALSRRGEDPRFTAHPSTWLNGERWNDEPVYARSNGSGAVSDQQAMRAAAALSRAARGVDGDF